MTKLTETLATDTTPPETTPPDTPPSGITPTGITPTGTEMSERDMPETDDRAPGAAPAPYDPSESWQDSLADGRVWAAVRRYQEEGAADQGVLLALRDLQSLQEDLRARGYGRAKARLAELGDLPGLERGSLGEQLEHMGTIAKRIEAREPEDALAQLGGVTAPPLLAEADTLRGTCHIYLQEPEAAEAAFLQALERDPKHYRAITNLGNLALEAGDVDGAIARYQEALAINGEFANAHHNLGVAYRRKGDVGRSVRSLRKAQGAQQRHMRQEARDTLRQGAGKSAGRYGRWLIYAVVAVALYFILRAQGFL
jgi:tetratricopeptide (TPR) repeat protein